MSVRTGKVAAVILTAVLVMAGTTIEAEDFYFEGKFDVNTPKFDGYYAYADASAYGGSPERKTSNLEGGQNSWSTSVSASAASAYASARSESHISFRWDSNVFRTDCYTYSSALGSSNDDCMEGLAEVEADVSGTARLTVGSTVHPDGLPIYLRILWSESIPVWRNIGWGTCSGGGITGPTYRRGPAWSLIEEYLPGTCHPSRSDCPPLYTLSQIGDVVEIGVHRNMRSFASSCDGSSEFELATLSSSDVDVRLPTAAEKVVKFWGGPTATNEFFGEDLDHPCSYAAMAMVIDHWATRYPQELDQPSQEEYYEAFDLLRDELLQDPCLMPLDRITEIMNGYFAAKNGCRSGAPVPLQARVMGVKSLARLVPEGPVMCAAEGFDDPKEAHAFVIDGIYCCRDLWSESGESLYWIAVRDTWRDAPDTVKVLSYDRDDPERARYRSFMHKPEDGPLCSWWPAGGLLSVRFANGKQIRICPNAIWLVGKTSVEPACDLDADSDVDWSDLAVLVSNWLQLDCEYPDSCGGGDVNRDRKVDLRDLGAFAQCWPDSTQP